MSEPVPQATSEFVVTKEYRRFAEFCDTCRRYRYIGLCYGPPGVGKTLSARHYAQTDLFEAQLPRLFVEYVPPEFLSCRTLLYTPTLTSTPKRIEKDVAQLRLDLNILIEAGTQLQQGKEEWSMPYHLPDRLELFIVDEADRLKTVGLEQLRDIYDRGRFGLARYAQLYSRVGFVHEFHALSTEEAHFILTQKWQQWGLNLQLDDFTDAEAIAAIIRITGGNFRLMQRLLTQIERILQINERRTVTKEVVEAARENLVIGLT